MGYELHPFIIKGIRNELKGCARHVSGYVTMKSHIILFTAFLSLLIGLTSCKDPLITVYGSNLDFKAVNLRVESDGQVRANSSGAIITTTVTLNLTINGVLTSVSVISKSNELLVQAGDEIELTFYPSCPEETEAFISMPDGSNHKVSLTSPSFKWIVPDNFTDGMEITGTSRYETNEAEYIETGVIKLIALDKRSL